MQPSIQEFEAQLALITNPVEKIDQLNKFVKNHVDIDPHKSIDLCLEAVQLAQKTPGNNKGLYDSLTNLAICRMRLGETEQALADAMQAYTLANSKQNIAVTSGLLNVLGVLFQGLGEYAEALDYYLKALSHNTEESASQQESLLVNLGILYHQLKDYDQELKQYERALALQQNKAPSRMTAILLNNMAMAYKAMEQLDTAVTKAKQSLQLTQATGSPILETTALCTLGELYLEQQKFDLALLHLTQSAEQARKLKVRYLEAYSLRQIGELFQQKGEPEQALSHLQQALTLATEIKNMVEMSACLNTLAQIHKNMGDFEQALRYFEQFHTLDKKLYEEQADRTVRQLQIVHQTRAIQQEAELYKQKTEELDAYARTVAHDLKQPIAAILGYTDLLPQIVPDLPTDSLLHKAITTINQSAEQANKTISALLLLATVNKTAVPLKQIDMATAVQNSLDQLAPIIQKAQATIQLPETWETAVGHQPWLEEVWHNYLSNALKYSGPTPHITIGCENYTSTMNRFWVKDQGPGVPAKFRTKLFSEFNILPNSDKNSASHGLGLAIVKRIIEKLGGEVGYEPLPQKGSLFYFTLPKS